MPKISVIVPVYKVEKYLDQCVRSIVNQTYRNLEIILVDDGSPDCCPAMCDVWAEKDERIRVIHQLNGGLSAARNAGLNLASGEYIGFVDSDDLIEPDMYEIMLKAFDGEEIGIVCCSAQHISEEGELLRKSIVPLKRKMNVQQALDSIFTLQADISVWSKLYRREVLDGIRFPIGETNEDAPITVPTIVKARGMIHVQECLYLYRQRVNSITSQIVPSEKNSDIVYRNFSRIEEQLGRYALKKRGAFRFFKAQYSYSKSLYYEKKHDLLTEKIKNDHKIYKKIMWQNATVYVCSRYSSFKNKLLYILILTKLLRPIYMLLCPEKL